MLLSSEQIHFFETQGYLVIEQFISDKSCEKLMERMSQLIEIHQYDIPKTVFSSKTNDHSKQQYFLDSGDKIHFFLEPDALNAHGVLNQPLERSLNKVGHGLHELDPIFKTFSRDTRFKAIAHQLGIKTIGLAQSMYIFKQPGIGSEVQCHQDSTYIWGHNSDALGFWFALEDATEDNGCLEVIPSSPMQAPLKTRMFRHHNEIHFEQYDTSPWPEEQCISLPVPKGSLVLLQGKVPHKSKANRSDKSRHAYTLHMVDITQPYPETNWLQWPHGMPVL